MNGLLLWTGYSGRAGCSGLAIVGYDGNYLHSTGGFSFIGGSSGWPSESKYLGYLASHFPWNHIEAIPACHQRVYSERQA